MIHRPKCRMINVCLKRMVVFPGVVYGLFDNLFRPVSRPAKWLERLLSASQL